MGFFSHLGMLRAKKFPPEISTLRTGAIPEFPVLGNGGFDFGGLFQPQLFHGNIGILSLLPAPTNLEFSRGNQGWGVQGKRDFSQGSLV